jgi:hypothetical protein
LDFGGATNSARAFNTSLQNFKVKDLANEFKTFLVTLGSLGKTQTANTVATKGATTATVGYTAATEGATVATNTFSAALKGTGILLLVTAVIALIANFDKLKDVGGVVGRVFTAIGDTIKGFVQFMKDFSDALGLTDFKNQEATKNLIKNSEERIKQYDKEKESLNRLLQRLNILGQPIEATQRMFDVDAATKAYNRFNELVAQAQKATSEEDKKNLLEQANKEWEIYTKLSEDIKDADAKGLKEKNDLERAGVDQRTAAQINSIKNVYSKERAAALEEKRLKQRDIEDEITKRSSEIGKFNILQNNLEFTISQTKDAYAKRNLESQLSAVKLRKDEEFAVIKVLEDQKIQLQQTTNTKLKETSIKERQEIAQKELGIIKSSGEEILKMEGWNITARYELQKSAINAQIRYIEANINKLFPIDPNLPRAQAMEKQRIESRLVLNGLIADGVKLEADWAERSKKAQQSRIDSEAELAKLQAKTLEERYAAEEKIINNRFEKEKEVADFIKMTPLEIQALWERNAVRRAEQITSLAELEKKKNKEVEDEKRKDIEATLDYNARRSADIATTKEADVSGKFMSFWASADAIEAGLKAQKDALKQSMDQEIQMAISKGESIFVIEEKYRALNAKADRDAQEAKLAMISEGINKGAALAEQGMQLANAIDTIAKNNARKNLKDGEKVSVDVQKKEFKRSQALGIVSVGIDTAKAIGALLPMYATNPIYAGILTGLIGATSIAQIAAIKSQKFVPETGSSTGGSSGGGITAPEVNQTNISTPTLFGLGQFDPSTVTGNKPQRVYVLESDITNAQKNVQQVQVSATF